MSPIIEAMKPSPNSDRQSCASSGELFPKNGTAFATESPTTFVSSRPTIFGSSRRPGIAGAIERFEAEVDRIPGPARVLAGIGLEARRHDAGDRAGLVALGGAAGNAGGADDVTRRGSYQHADGICDHDSLDCILPPSADLRRISCA